MIADFFMAADLKLLGELIKFLDDEKQDVRQLAIHHLLGFTNSEETVDYILSLDINPIQKCCLEVSVSLYNHTNIRASRMMPSKFLSI